MRHPGSDRYFGIEAAQRDLVRDVVRDEFYNICAKKYSGGSEREKDLHRPFANQPPMSS